MPLDALALGTSAQTAAVSGILAASRRRRMPDILPRCADRSDAASGFAPTEERGPSRHRWRPYIGDPDRAVQRAGHAGHPELRLPSKGHNVGTSARERVALGHQSVSLLRVPVPRTPSRECRSVSRYLPVRSRCLHPGQQQGRRWPSSSSSRVRRMRRSRVVSCLASSTQQMNSLRAKGVMSFQASSAVVFAISASRRSAGNLCTAPPGTRRLLTGQR